MRARRWLCSRRTGKPLLIFHDELGYPGWMTWNETLAHERTLLIPLQPGFGKTPRLEWVRTYRDLAGFYSQVVRELKLDPVDVIGYSAGGFIAAEMVAADPRIFLKMILVAPMGIKPEGEIDGYLSDHHAHAFAGDGIRSGRHARVSEIVRRRDDARAIRSVRGRARRRRESDGSLTCTIRRCRTCCAGPQRPLSWCGERDRVVPRGCIDAYQRAIAGAHVATIENACHRPEIENSTEFVRVVSRFLNG